MAEESRVYGTKYPESVENKDDEPIRDSARVPSEEQMKDGFNELLNHVVAAPPQGDAGSCLFMSHTGTLEWWINRIEGLTNAQKIDLSERYMMNLSKAKVGQSFIKNWRTDNVYRLNANQVHYRNETFPFTKLWWKRDANGERIEAMENEEGAEYGTQGNWVVMLNTLPNADIKLPKFERRVIHADTERNQWSILNAPKDIVSQIKNALETYRSPVNVIYNHHGFWHANVIVGYHDEISTNNCEHVRTFSAVMNKKALDLRKMASETDNPKKKRKYLKKAKKYERQSAEVADELEKRTCSAKGVFYVRDSIYSYSEADMYDYDPTREGEEKRMNSPVILREYQWMELLGNHAFQIYPVLESQRK